MRLHSNQQETHQDPSQSVYMCCLPNACLQRCLLQLGLNSLTQSSFGDLTSKAAEKEPKLQAFQASEKLLSASDVQSLEAMLNLFSGTLCQQCWNQIDLLAQPKFGAWLSTQFIELPCTD